MEQQVKRRIEITFAILVLIAVVILIWFLVRPDAPSIQDSAPIVEDPEEQTPMPPAQPPPGPVEVLPTTVVRTFVERLGSYSNQAKASNIDDIVELSTEALQPRLILLADQARSNSGDGYYGVSTYVIAMNEIARDDQNVSYTVTTQRHESIDSPANTTMIYQDIQVSLVKNGVDWLVSDFQWQ